jgi:2-polyprenyl-6-hydroxyphenyl methylase/3-demethylubiquinone-9 3-methyltransferase
MNAASIPVWESYVAGRFDDRVEHYPASIPANDPRLIAIRSMMPRWNGLRLLDLGCGRGRYWPHWRSWGADITGIDISRKSLSSADNAGFKAIGTLTRLPWNDGSFDAVCILETLQHSPAPARALHEAMRVLRPGGSLIIVDRNPLALDPIRPWLPSVLIKWIDERRGLWMYPQDAPVRERWHRPSHWRHALAGMSSDWRLQYVDSTEEPATKIRRILPVCRPFYCLSGTKSDSRLKPGKARQTDS